MNITDDHNESGLLLQCGLNGLLSMRKDKGFSLVEVMTVIGIMAIVLAIAVPDFISYADGMKLRSASRDLYSTLQKTRMNAIRQNTRWAVEFTSSTYRVVDCGPDNVCSGSGLADNINGKTTDISEYPGVTIPSFPGTVEFYPDGTSNGGTLTFSNSTGKTSQVQVAISGRIRSS
jgi:prepilin-type N-terminal cleavage/methylation domain-containing protein